MGTEVMGTKVSLNLHGSGAPVNAARYVGKLLSEQGTGGGGVLLGARTGEVRSFIPVEILSPDKGQHI